MHANNRQKTYCPIACHIYNFRKVNITSIIFKKNSLRAAAKLKCQIKITTKYVCVMNSDDDDNDGGGGNGSGDGGLNATKQVSHESSSN